MGGERRLVIAGGGTGGHVLPAVAVREELGRRNLTIETLWIGSDDGVEREAAERAGITFKAIQTGKLRRYVSPRTLVDAARVPTGAVQAWRLLRTFRPDIVFSTGGFVSVPTVVAASRLAPILSHEQTAILGLANRINVRFANVLAISYEGTTAGSVEGRARVVLTGNPVRSSLASGNAERGLARWGFTPRLPLLFVTGGARGASPLNRRLGAMLPGLLEQCQVLHQTGPASANPDAADVRRQRDLWPEHLRDRYRVVEFVRDELADTYAAATLVLGRAGAGTVAELAFLGKPSVLVPLPGAGGDEQTRNAALLADAGAAVVVPQKEATPEHLRTLIQTLVGDSARLNEMAMGARTIAQPDAAARLTDELILLAGWRAEGLDVADPAIRRA